MFVMPASGQYGETTKKYKEVMQEEEEKLAESMKDNSYIAEMLAPDTLRINLNRYRFDTPAVTDFRLNIILDPCRGNSPDCCMHSYGTPEYGILIRTPEPYASQKYRATPKVVMATPTEISTNYILEYDDGSEVASTDSRIPIDEV